MDRREFKEKFVSLLEQEVLGLAQDKKLKYMKKWIRDYEKIQQDPTVKEEHRVKLSSFQLDSTKKIGVLVRTTLREMVNAQLITSDRLRLLQDANYCKNTFDINYPFLIKVVHGVPLSNQRKINGYDRYWSEPITINNERFMICNDWYERNKSKYIRWVEFLT